MRPVGNEAFNDVAVVFRQGHRDAASVDLIFPTFNPASPAEISDEFAGGGRDTPIRPEV